MFLQRYPVATEAPKIRYVPSVFGFGFCRESDVKAIEEDD
jgi:hypothetical protein